MSTETELYTDKENARSALENAIADYLTAAEAFDMDVYDIADEISDIFADLSSTLKVIIDV